MILHTRIGVSSLLLLLLATATAGVAPLLPETMPPDAISFSRRVWRSADGLPEDFAQSVAQTPDGYLWIGTSGGLVRFDGSRFFVFNGETVPAFKDDSVYSMLVTKDGTLWVDTEGGGLIRYKDRSFSLFGEAEGLSNGFVRVIFEDRSGNCGLVRMPVSSECRASR